MVSFLLKVLCLFHLTLAWANPDIERTKVHEDMLWQRSAHHMANVEVNKVALGGLLAPLLSYKFLLPMPQLRAGFAYAGSRTRLRRFVRDLVHGHRPLKIGAVGGRWALVRKILHVHLNGAIVLLHIKTILIPIVAAEPSSLPILNFKGKKRKNSKYKNRSVTWGQGVSNRANASWFGLVAHWLARGYPSVNITARNGAVPATQASYMVMCLDQWVDPDVDLVFVEYILNNGIDDRVFNNPVVQVMERLIRRLMDLPGKPAVVLMQASIFVRLSVCLSLRPPISPRRSGRLNRTRHFPCRTHPSPGTGALAQYYDVQYLSLRTALYRLAAVDQKDGFRWNQMFVDHHPGDAGNHVMADLVAYMIQNTALDLMLDPITVAETQALDQALPPPMYDGNVPPAASMCLTGERFSDAVVFSSGFNYTNEGTSPDKPKWGYVATSPGATLVMRFDTSRPHMSPSDLVSLYLFHLKSYEHMGMAGLTCTAGCYCDAVEVDGHVAEHWSQMCHARFQVSQAAACEVTLTVLSTTNSGEHKFKVSGMILSEDHDSAKMMDGTANPEGRPYVQLDGQPENLRRRRSLMLGTAASVAAHADADAASPSRS
ncbi:hypothetical protein VOLCADRAFT_106525 [Volvox carteri f. nagariensis]|uniref:SGNH hydrolase-type esterase domain-containing protein n=1 Tax=Volvox carteri f. nagariensis TaxID=3068 RepID=D8U7T1_VOLCA|nr:uncharacterized protein VOLCADRAFT_106525 [Volvox carteri f. nagariensis]EFJ44198.1 hypothetical protein VOLCADRAFT_106525 [Volvox carteri f. nagariensis]|eukprot:XP_002954792.1 hypothetical protein VOLCADRAFT_106525 [Volvox carteri f. nagariensis]